MKNTSKNTCVIKFSPSLMFFIICFIVFPGLAGGSLLEKPPVIISVTPSKSLAKAETLITISGQGIVQGASVKIGKKVVIPMAYFPPKSLTVYSPPGAPGRVDVTLTNPDGQFFVFSEGFQYVRNLSGFTDRDKPIIDIKRKLHPPMTRKEKLKNFFGLHRSAIMKAGVYGGIFCLLLILFSFSKKNRVVKRIRREGKK